MICKKLFASWLVIALLFVIVNANGQGNTESSTPVYLDINKMGKTKVTDISIDELGLQYMDAYGKNSTIVLKILDWKRKQVGELNLTKSKGQNHYVLNLESILPNREKNKVYTFFLIDEVSNKYEFLVRFIDRPKNEISINIDVNPKYMHCTDNIEENLVEFYGNVDHGKVPYIVTWYILNSDRTKFLYQPKEQRVERPGITPSILVDKSPDYYVIMTVLDACGSEQHQIVHLKCEEEQKKINTVFFENIQGLTDKKWIQ